MTFLSENPACQFTIGQVVRLGGAGGGVTSSGELKSSTDLLFHAVKDPTEHLPHGTFQNAWKKVRSPAGRPDLRLHALRHYAGTRYAQTGATLKETMARLGHNTSTAAMHYQHAGTRDDELAQRMAR